MQVYSIYRVYFDFMGCLVVWGACCQPLRFVALNSTRFTFHISPFGIWALLDVLRCHFAVAVVPVVVDAAVVVVVAAAADALDRLVLAFLCFKQAAHFMAMAISRQ